MENESLFKEYEGIFAPMLEEIGGPTESVDQAKKERTYAYSPFALQDAVGERSVKKIWIEYEKLKLAGIESEELIHKVVSKVRDMLAISLGASQEDLNIKDYTFIKSKKDAKNWEEKELKNLYTKFVSAYHQSRMGGEELETALEKVLLSI